MMSIAGYLVSLIKENGLTNDIGNAMYKATASSQQFFNREAMHSTKGSRKGFDLLDHGESPIDQLTPEQKRQNLVAQWKSLNDKIVLMRKNDPERIIIGRQMQSLQIQINKIRPKMQGTQLVGGYFIEVAKRKLSKAMYQIIMDEASELARNNH